MGLQVTNSFEKMSCINKHTPEPNGRHATISCDGSCPSNPGPMGIGYIIDIADDAGPSERIEFGTRFGPGTNNKAEYLSLIFALRHALRAGVTHVAVNMDSLLIVSQVDGRWKCSNKALKLFNLEAVNLAALFTRFHINHIPREENADADFLSRHPTDSETLPPTVEINLGPGKRTRKFSRQQAAMIRWWWATNRCRSEYLLTRIFGGTPSHLGKIGKGEVYEDITAADIPRRTPCTVVTPSPLPSPSHSFRGSSPDAASPTMTLGERLRTVKTPLCSS